MNSVGVTTPPPTVFDTHTHVTQGLKIKIELVFLSVGWVMAGYATNTTTVGDVS